MYSSNVNLDNKRVYFIRNTASSGGAIIIALKNQSLTIFNTNVEMTVFRENKANQYGGAVYVKESSLCRLEKSGGAIALRQKSE